MKKIYYITTFIAILIVSFLGITYSFEYANEEELTFELIGPSNLYLDVDTEYTEYGIKVLYDGKDVSDKVKIDTSKINVKKVGEYKVKYQYANEYVYRDVVVIDKESPEITLLGGDEVDILLGGNYHESGYTVTDNYDKDLEKKVKVDGKVNVNKEGEYILNYTVSDNGGNVGTAKRKVIVHKGVISAVRELGGRVSSGSYNVYLYSNTVV